MLPERHVRDWILETLAWLIRELRPALPLPRPLLLPSDAHFPVAAGLPPVRRAEALFECLRRQAGLAALRCEIAPQPSAECAPGDLPFGLVAAEPEPAATFERRSGAGRAHRIHYHPELLADPMRLLAILSHGLGHALLSAAATPPPGGDEAWDAATDLAAVLVGSGVFLANAALVVRREEALLYEGLVVRCQGWLGQGDLAFALAAFLHLFPQPGVDVARYLRTGPRLELARSHALLAAREHRPALRGLEALV